MSDMPRVLREGMGIVMGSPEACTDRFMIDGPDAGGRFALVEHTIATIPRSSQARDRSTDGRETAGSPAVPRHRAHSVR